MISSIFGILVDEEEAVANSELGETSYVEATQS